MRNFRQYSSPTVRKADQWDSVYSAVRHNPGKAVRMRKVHNAECEWPISILNPALDNIDSWEWYMSTAYTGPTKNEHFLNDVQKHLTMGLVYEHGWYTCNDCNMNSFLPDMEKKCRECGSHNLRGIRRWRVRAEDDIWWDYYRAKKGTETYIPDPSIDLVWVTEVESDV